MFFASSGFLWISLAISKVRCMSRKSWILKPLRTRGGEVLYMHVRYCRKQSWRISLSCRFSLFLTWIPPTWVLRGIFLRLKDLHVLFSSVHWNSVDELCIICTFSPTLQNRLPFFKVIFPNVLMKSASISWNSGLHILRCTARLFFFPLPFWNTLIFEF